MSLNKPKVLILSIILIIIIAFGISRRYSNVNDFGLHLLSWTKQILGQQVDLSSIHREHSTIINHTIWNELLTKHVDTTGKVNYEGFIKDSVKLSIYLDLLRQNPPGDNWSESEQLAYWINTYNAYTVKLIVDHYPLNSIKEVSDGLPMISSVWDIKFFKILETPFDLNTIEHEILRKTYDEFPIHFAINCASFSCPKLRNEAYKSELLDRQLDKQAFYFINNPEKNIINEKEISLSKIFDWFNSDFTKETDLRSYIGKYKPIPNNDIKIEYLPYNWALNN